MVVVGVAVGVVVVVAVVVAVGVAVVVVVVVGVVVVVAMTARTAEIAVDRLMSRAEKAQAGLRRAWEDYSTVPGAAAVTLDRLARAYDALDRLRALLSGSRDSPGLLGLLTEEIGPRVPQTETGAQAFVEGVGRVIRRSKSERERWDPDALVPAVAGALGARIADTPGVVADEDGVARPPSEIARRATAEAVTAMADLCGMTPSRAWRTGALEGIGLDPRAFRERTWGGYTIQVERGVIDGTPQAQTDDERGTA